MAAQQRFGGFDPGREYAPRKPGRPEPAGQTCSRVGFRDLSNLDNLTRLRLHNNSLSGEVPATLGDQ